MLLNTSWLRLVIVIGGCAATSAAYNDEVGRCGLTGVYKIRQSVLQSPLYPRNYPPSGCWDYVIRSPYRCPTNFHIQFLEFALEPSSSCANDYLAVGPESDDAPFELLCGQVVGIKTYYTPDGALRLRFYSDDSPWTTEKGFKLLVTRLACEDAEDAGSANIKGVNGTSDRFGTPLLQLQPPHNNHWRLFRNLSGLPETFSHLRHHKSIAEHFPQAEAVHQSAFIWTADRERPALETCCADSFRKQHFYLSSPGFPRTAFVSLLPLSQRDCHFHLEKTSPSVCGLRIELKFFDFGRPSNGNGAAHSLCFEDYLEIDGERFCGCQTGKVLTVPWGFGGMKSLRLRMGYSGITSSGFLLAVMQEECSSSTQLEAQFGQIVAPSAIQSFAWPQFHNYLLPNHQKQTIPKFYEAQQIQLPSLRVPSYPEARQPPVWPPEHVHDAPLPPQLAAHGSRQFRRTKRWSIEQWNQQTVVDRANMKPYNFTEGGDILAQRTMQKKRQIGYQDAGNSRFSAGILFTEKNRCRFDSSDIFRLSMDLLWLTKPTCYSAARNWIG